MIFIQDNNAVNEPEVYLFSTLFNVINFKILINITLFFHNMTGTCNKPLKCSNHYNII